MSANPEFDDKDFRHALGAFTTGVTIVTTRAPDCSPVGVTANSFNSVSLDPPLVLWSLAKKAWSMAAFEQASHWAVHVLASDQQDLSDRFARRGEDKFANLDASDGAGGAPLLNGCSSRFECRTTHRYDGGDHVIFVGEVLNFARSARPPLVFHRGGYAVATHRIAETRAPSDWDPAPSFGEDFLDYLLSRAHFQIYQGIRSLARDEGLSDAEWFILSSLTAKDGRSLDELVAMYLITGVTLTAAMVERLHRAGLVDAGNEPAGAITMTDMGRRLAVRVLAAAKAQEASITSRLGEPEAEALKSLLRDLIRVTDPGLPDMWGRPTA